MSANKPEIDLGNHHLKNKVLLTLSMMILCSCLVTGFHNIFSDGRFAHWVAASQISMAIFFAYTSLRLLKNRAKPWFNWTVVYAYIALIAFAVVIFGVHQSVSMWFFSVPVVSYFIFSRRHGFAISLCVLALFIYLQINYNLGEPNKVWSSSLINIVLPYSVIMALANAYEKVRIQNEWELSEFALTDALTKCYNRLALKSLYPTLQSAQRHTALMLIDIDHFKRINDCYGHEAGDQVLKALSKVFIGVLGEKQVFRIGGEEFLLVLEGDSEACKSLAEVIRNKVQHMNFHYNGEALNITLSGGYKAISPGAELTDILKVVDEALYKAKSQGRNTVVYV